MCRHLLALPLALALALAGCSTTPIVDDRTATPSPGSPAASESPCSPGAQGSRIDVRQSSMEPTLEPGDVVQVIRDTPRLGDIVAFRPPAAWSSDPTPFLKRVIGLGGDMIEIRGDGRVFRNGAALDEPYTFADAAGVHEPTDASPDATSWEVPGDAVFVLGDHRRRSADSRVFGPVPVSNLIGVATWRCTPTEGPLR
jgi:signal peptidase I